jgi:hypothetical protein
VMGAHWAWLGYADVDALVAEARSGVGGQVRLMARYIDKAGLSAAIRRRDRVAFAHGYNGPAFARHGYDRKIAVAYERYRSIHLEPKATALAARPIVPAKPIGGSKSRLFAAWLASLLLRRS